MTWGIIGTLPEETRLITQQMHTGTTETLAGFDFHLGIIGANRGVVVNCGGGKVNAAVCTALLIERFRAGHIVTLGVAGSLSPDLQVLDVVVAEAVLFHDVDPGLFLRQPPRLPSFQADPGMNGRILRSVDEMASPGFACKTGVLASGDRFISDDGVKGAIAAGTGALCVDMWGASSAQAAALFGIPFTAVRCISDDAGEDSAETYEKYFAAAAAQPSYLVLGLL
jgi:adenosylhomocysteine nucleosidase